MEDVEFGSQQSKKGLGKMIPSFLMWCMLRERNYCSIEESEETLQDLRLSLSVLFTGSLSCMAILTLGFQDSLGPFTFYFLVQVIILYYFVYLGNNTLVYK